MTFSSTVVVNTISEKQECRVCNKTATRLAHVLETKKRPIEFRERKMRPDFNKKKNRQGMRFFSDVSNSNHGNKNSREALACFLKKKISKIK